MKLADNDIIPAVLAKIEMLHYAQKICGGDPISRLRRDRWKAAKERLEDFATVELLCEGLGITRKEIE